MKSNIKSIILLALRLYVGYVIAKHGYDKLMNMDMTIGFIGKMTGLSAGYAWAVAIGELASGLGLIFGAWTRLAALGATIIMAGVVYYTNGGDGILLLAGTIILALAGGGKYALITCKDKSWSKKTVTTVTTPTETTTTTTTTTPTNPTV